MHGRVACGVDSNMTGAAIREITERTQIITEITERTQIISEITDLSPRITEISERTHPEGAQRRSSKRSTSGPMKTVFWEAVSNP